MKKYFAITAIAATTALLAGNAMAQSAPAPAAAPDPGPVTANVTLASEYRYRGISQSNFKPAIQGGFDYAHESGFYIGNWNSSISWIADSYTPASTGSQISSQIEMDFYAGFKKEIAKDTTLDLGLLQYYYPTSGAAYSASMVNPNSTEAYVALSYQFVTLKYSYSLTDLFGNANTKGSSYIDLSANYDTGVEGITLNAHAGYQKYANASNLSYTDWKLGLTKDLGKGLSISAAYIGTNADGNQSFYQSPNSSNLGKSTAVLSLTKTF